MCLGIAQSLLQKLMAGRYPVPHPLLLPAVGMVLAHHQALLPLATTRTSDPEEMQANDYEPKHKPL